MAPLILAVLAAAGPSLLAYNVSPSPTFLNQALAFVLWGAFTAAWAQSVPQPAWTHSLRDAAPVALALALVAAAALWSWGPGGLPSSLALSAIGALAAAAVLLLAGAAARGADSRGRAFAVFCLAWTVAGVANVAIGAVQVFAPAWADGDWIAQSSIVGRAVGNLRQPNHLSSVLLWAAIAVIALGELGHLRRAVVAGIQAAMIFGVVLTASRTGLVSVGVLAVWGLLDRGLSRGTRALLLASPLLYALAWMGMAGWAEASHHTFGGAARLAETDVSGSRFGVWSNTLALIRQNSWTGVGFGEFNFAWTLSPFPGRPVAFFDHTHNLVLQLAVELGLPLAAGVTGLLLWGLVSVWRRGLAGALAQDHAGLREQGVAQRAAGMFVLMIGLHSLLEYPLWYAYFLLPAAWAFGYGLGRPAPAARSGSRGLAPAGALIVVLALASVWDYLRVVEIFEAPEDAAPLAERIARGQRSVLFSHHADYAAVTTEVGDALREQAFDGATHYLLDTRLMMAWAEDLARRGRLDEARHLVERLREFHNPLARDFLGVCERPASGAMPFQCSKPTRDPPWREFLPR